MSKKPKIAAVQMASGPNFDANLLEAERLIRESAEAGAGLVVLPENFAFMGPRIQDLVPLAEAEGEGPMQGFLSRVSAKYAVWLVGGTVPLQARTPERVRSACLVFDERGRRVARYDKIHLFDVTLPGVDERYEESAAIEPGEATLVLDSPLGRLGVAVCYDLRFPEQFRRMLDDSMEVVALPACFTALTGKAHWETLVRARAIENLAYVAAAAQGGYHVNGRETHGHSMIVDPWGSILAEVQRGTGFVCHGIDSDYVQSVRRTFPAVSHRRLK